ncbi:FAD-binding monooxygenase, partial [Syncephalastrum racemosum]
MYDCFISGAGPVGLFFAYQLAKAGHSVYICDAKKSPAQYQSRALGMTARTIEVLENRGVASHFLKEASVIRGVEVFIYGSKAGTISVSALDNPYPHLTGLPQDRTETILGDLLGALGTPIHWETSCVDYSQSDDGVEVRIKRHQEGEGDQQEEVIRAKYIVGADGTHSQVRRVTDSWTYEGYAVATRFALADVVLKGEDAEKYLSNALYGKMFYQEKGVFGLFPLKVYEDGSVRVRAFGNLGSYELDKTERNSSTHGIESELSLEDLQKVIDERLAPLKVTVTDPTWISNFRINERKANGFRRGRAFVMG